jgi:DNA-binding transcriptional LysR family regulator
MLDVAKLQTLRAVIECGSFSAAAQEQNLSQPAVSRQISLLERQLNTMLVRRTSQGVLPTEAGRILLGHSETVLGLLARAEAEVGELAGLQRGTVRLGSFFSALVHLSAQVGAVLGKAHPGIVIVDELVDRSTALHKVRNGDLDLAIVFDNDFEPAEPAVAVELHDLFDDPLRVVLPARHRLARRRSIRVEDLSDDTWIRAHDGSAARRIDHVLAGAGLHPALLLAGHGDEPFEAQALVAAGRGITLTHTLTVDISGREIVVRPFSGSPGSRLVQAAVQPGRRPPAVQAALEALLRVGASRRRRAVRSRDLQQ